MKKLLAGCLVVLVLAGVALAVGAYFVYRAASPVIQNARNYLGQLSQLGELEKDIKNTAPFATPKSDELSKDQVDRFARVQQQVRTALGRRFDEIEAKYKHLKANADPKQAPSFGEVLSALGDLANVAVDARRAQIDALNEEGFSSAEYAWVRSRVYQAAGVEAATAIDFQKIAEAARKGTGIEGLKVPEKPLAAVPPKNRELVKPHLSHMDEWLPLAFFGL